MVRAPFETIKQRLAVSLPVFIGAFTYFKAIKTRVSQDLSPIFLDQYLIQKLSSGKDAGRGALYISSITMGLITEGCFFQGLFVKSGNVMYFKVGAIYTAYQ